MLEVTPVRPTDRFPALAILRGNAWAASMRAAMLDDAFWTPFLAAYDGPHMRGVVFCQRLAGSAAVVWPPQTQPPSTDAEDLLVRAAFDHVPDAKYVQAFLPTAEFALAAPLLRQGFQYITRVRHFAWSGVAEAASILRPYNTLAPHVFLDLLMACHDESLDGPELNGLRTPDEVFEGYMEVAPDPGQWWFAEQDGQPAGVLLLHGSEVVFLGVHPHFRRRGIGRQLLQFALQTSAHLQLIVDDRNTPALELYQSLGFVETAQQEVLLWRR